MICLTCKNKDIEGKKPKSVLFKHKMTDHRNENVKFQMTNTNKFKDALTRQANEAVRICSVLDKNSRNSKSEQAGAELCQAQFKLG